MMRKLFLLINSAMFLCSVIMKNFTDKVSMLHVFPLSQQLIKFSSSAKQLGKTALFVWVNAAMSFYPLTFL